MLGCEKRMPRVTSLPTPAAVRPRLPPTLHRLPPAPFSFHQAQLPYQVPAWLLGTNLIISHVWDGCQVLSYLDSTEALAGASILQSSPANLHNAAMQPSFRTCVSPIYLGWIKGTVLVLPIRFSVYEVGIR